jgi:hypothetical protein
MDTPSPQPQLLGLQSLLSPDINASSFQVGNTAQGLGPFKVGMGMSLMMGTLQSPQMALVIRKRE